jgi:hypothetical protein
MTLNMFYGDRQEQHHLKPNIMNATKRLSLADFKVSKVENQNEIDKLVGGAAAACHLVCTGPSKMKVGDLIITGEKDYTESK